MIVAVDVHYGSAVATACVGFNAWTDAAPAAELVVRSSSPPEPYVPGEFYRREMPHVLAAIARFAQPVDTLVVDGYVWLANGAPGLGAHLHRALGVPVVGVAKRTFAGAPSIAVLRGTSRQALHVTTAGIDAAEAAARIVSMHGAHRIPTLLARADRLARTSV